MKLKAKKARKKVKRIKKINVNKHGLFENINTIVKPVARLTKEKKRREKTQLTNIRSERGNITYGSH